jgi:hypothetical protein
MKRNKKAFDCVEMMHRGGRAIQAVTDKMTFEEEVEYWKRQSEEFEKEIETARRKAKRKLATPRG